MKFDSYGGNSAYKGKATGFFHLQKIDGRHFLITPEGNGFRALGINHFHNMTSTDFDGAIRNIKDWGFNAGCYEGPMFMRDKFPYTQGINLVPVCWWMSEEKFGYKDVFDPKFLAVMEKQIRNIVAPQKENKMLIGFFLTDIPVWERKRDHQDWISFFRNLPTESPGGNAWLEWKKMNPHADENRFLAVIARQLYAKGYEYLRKYDKNHLLFSDRYHEVDMPDHVVQEAVSYVDAIAVQPTSREFNPDFFDNLYAKYGKPVYIADHVSSFATEEHRITMEQAANDMESYLIYYGQYVTAALSRPYVVGYNKCQYQDKITAKGVLKQGLLQKNGTPYPIIKGIMAANLKALDYVWTGTEPENMK